MGLQVQLDFLQIDFSIYLLVQQVPGYKIHITCHKILKSGWINSHTLHAVPISMVALPEVLKSTEPHQYTVYIHKHECRLMIEAREGPYTVLYINILKLTLFDLGQKLVGATILCTTDSWAVFSLKCGRAMPRHTIEREKRGSSNVMILPANYSSSPARSVVQVCNHKYIVPAVQTTSSGLV